MKSVFKKSLGFAALLGGLVLGQSAANAATCTYNVQNEWNTGLVAEITIKNTDSTPINGWTVNWRYTTNSITNLWNANLSGTNPYTASSLSWNSNIQPGQSITFGFQADKRGGAAERPTVTGSVCGGVVASSSVPSSVSLSSRSSSVISQSSRSATPSSRSAVPSSRSATPSSVPPSSTSRSSSSIASGVALKDLADYKIGVAVRAGTENNPIATNTRQQEIVFKHFDQFTAENIMKMSYLHPDENRFTFTDADNLITFANSNGISVHAHTLIWHSDYQVPNWMRNYPGDAAAFSAMLKTHVQTIVSHFAGKVDSWDVVNEAFVDNGDGSGINGYRNSVFYQKLGPKFIDEAFINARAADAAVDLYYNDYNTEANDGKTTNMLNMIDGLLARRVPITGVGFQMHVLPDWPSLANIEASFRAVVSRGLKVKITEFDVRVNNPYNPSLPKYTSLTPEAAANQKQRYRDIIAVYLRVVPASLRGGITVWGVKDDESWLANQNGPDWPLLWDANYQQKPAFQGFVDGLTSQ
jgi:endo-1,4-beta-xylanase